MGRMEYIFAGAMVLLHVAVAAVSAWRFGLTEFVYSGQTAFYLATVAVVAVLGMGASAGMRFEK